MDLKRGTIYDIFESIIRETRHVFRLNYRISMDTVNVCFSIGFDYVRRVVRN